MSCEHCAGGCFELECSCACHEVAQLRAKLATADERNSEWARRYTQCNYERQQAVAKLATYDTVAQRVVETKDTLIAELRAALEETRRTINARV